MEDKKPGELGSGDNNQTADNQAASSGYEPDSLDAPTTVDESAADNGETKAAGAAQKPPNKLKAAADKFTPKKLLKLFKTNTYLMLLVLILLIAGIAAFAYYQKNRSARDSDLASQPLSQEVLDKLKQSDVRVGGPKQILNVESNAVFSGKVLIRGDLEVAGQIKVGGPLNLSGITVSGLSVFDQVNLNSLDISGNNNIQGQLSVQKSVTVAGNLSVGGSLSASQLTLNGLQLSGDLLLNRHIDAGGGSPSKSDGGALGAGGTSSVSGTDTAGTVNISTGGGTGSGCYVTVRFNQKFNNTPHVVITPVGSPAGGLNYYINRSASEFSICTTNSAGSGQSFAFDYIVID